jgi:hypothetical protein
MICTSLERQASSVALYARADFGAVTEGRGRQIGCWKHQRCYVIAVRIRWLAPLNGLFDPQHQTLYTDSSRLKYFLTSESDALK